MKMKYRETAMPLSDCLENVSEAHTIRKIINFKEIGKKSRDTPRDTERMKSEGGKNGRQ